MSSWSWSSLLGIQSTKNKAAADIMAIKGQAAAAMPKELADPNPVADPTAPGAAGRNASTSASASANATASTRASSVPAGTAQPMEALPKGIDERYRAAKPETVEFMRQTQNQKMGLSGVNDPMAIQKYIREQEGLDLGVQRRRELAQQWRFFLTCEPIQRGMDAGLVMGSVSAFAAAYQPKNRHPLKICCFWCGGFSVGMITLPLALTMLELYNMERIKGREGELFSRQREAFHAQDMKNE